MVAEAIGGIAGNVRKSAGNLVPDPLQDLFGGLPRDGVADSSTGAKGTFNNGAQDWRVKLSIPGNYKNIIETSEESSLMQPLLDANAFIFPYTPNIYIAYTAAYDKLSPTHSNYPFPIYQNSSVDQFVITGTFTVENASEGAYWIAANQYLRSVTKMAYGRNTTNRGSPPPIVKLNGYGDFVFKDVPVVVEQYTVTLPEDVDYIQVPVGPNGSYVPTRSEISITVFPTYSRDKINKFSLDSFVKGDYVTNGAGYI